MAAHIGLDLLAQGHAAIDHGQDDADDMQLGVERLLHPLDRVAQRADAFERQELRLQGHQDGIDRDQRIQGHQAERGRAVDQDGVPALAGVGARRSQRVVQPVLAPLDIDQLDLGAGELDRRPA